MKKEKVSVAAASVVAAVFLTSFKLIVGLFTGSLGILSEALHSMLDMVAAVITFFSVSVSDKPADKEHNYGHGKVENLSALIETLLLIATCVWIVYEAISRLWSGNTQMEVSVWSYVVVISSIVIDVVRSRKLKKVAKKYDSQALEADALHFSTDIWSSVVVLVGLVCAHLGFHFADSLAALAVACIVAYISIRLGKRAVDVLLDKAPVGIDAKVTAELNTIPEILRFHDLRIRTSGADTFVRVNVHLHSDLDLKTVHEICDKIEQQIGRSIPRCEACVHPEPED